MSHLKNPFLTEKFLQKGPMKELSNKLRKKETS